MVFTVRHQMGSKVTPLSRPILFSTKRCRNHPSLLLQPKHKSRPTACSSPYQRSSQPITTVQTQVPKTGLYSVEFQTLRDCKLGISRYPDFSYNAEGGKGTATGRSRDETPTKVSVSFDLQTLFIPPMTSATTSFLGLPLPPLLKIDIVPELFHGTIDEETGQVDLEFKAKFLFSVGSIYRAPPLGVVTVLTSEESKGVIRMGRGKRLDDEGKCRLVGVATVDPIEDAFMNTFLSLPTECLADMSAKISISGCS